MMAQPALAVSETSPVVNAADSIADPGPLGLSAFATTTLVLSAVNAGMIPLSVKSVVLSLALFYGGTVQLVAGIWEFKKNNIFGATAFCSYGGFWLAYWGLSVFFKPAQGTPANDVDIALGFFLLAWTIFTAMMTVAVLRTNWALATTFIVLVITFVLLAAGHFAHSESLEKLGGWLGLVTALLAFYCAFAGVVNGTWKRQVIPVWKI
jgi:succinate-acetate transporter protein